MVPGDVKVNITTANAEKGALFDGVDDYVTADALPIIKNKAQSVHVRVFPRDVTSENKIIISNYFSATEQWNMRFTSSNQKLAGAFYRDDGGSVYEGRFGSDGAIPKGEWLDVVVVYNGDTLGASTANTKLFINGVEQTNVAENAGAAFGSSGVTFGQRNDLPGSGILDGCIGLIEYFEVELTDTEAVNLAAGINVTRGLRNRWKFDKDYTDSVGGNDGTNSGSILQIVEQDVAAAIKAARTNENDTYMMVGVAGQIISTVTDESPPA